jgi:hypothetical protein
MTNFDFSAIPTAFYVCILVLAGLFLFSVVAIIFWIVKNRDIKIKDFAVTKTQKELYQAEGKNTLDNQTSNAHNLLKKIWLDIYDIGRKRFNITDNAELFLLEDIAHLIEDKLNYEVKNDLTRNHITEKDDFELTKYSDAKAVGYYRSVRASLYSYNIQLPKYDLPDILDEISVDDYRRLFNEVYFCARKIAGGNSKC